MSKEKEQVVDKDYQDSAVPQSSRRSTLTMFMIMMGFTFFSASMWAGKTLADGMDFSNFLSALMLGGEGDTALYGEGVLRHAEDFCREP